MSFGLKVEEVLGLQVDAKIVGSYLLGLVRGVQFMSRPGQADEKEIDQKGF